MPSWHSISETIRNVLVPRPPHRGILAILTVPAAAISSISVASALVSVETEVGTGHFITTLLPFLYAGLGLLVVFFWVPLTPPQMFRSRNLALALAAAYMPFIIGGTMSVWLIMWLASRPILEGFIPFSVPVIAFILGTSTLIWILIAVFTNHLAETRERQQHYADELAARLQELEESRQRIVSVQESVRREIARHLHGSVQNRVILLMHHLYRLEREAPSEGLAAELGALQRDFGESLQNDLRSISHQLYPSILRLGLVPALQSLGEGFESVFEVALELDDTFVSEEREDRGMVPEQVRLAAYRIVEEALNNVVKHAEATTVGVRLDYSPGTSFRITVWDNGRGFEPGAVTAGLGTAVMRDYAEAVGGRCVVRGVPGQGAEAIATLPFGGPPGERRATA